MPRLLAAWPAILVLGALIVAFIGVPLGAMLVRSASVAAPLPPIELVRITGRALALLPEVERSALLRQWAERATDRQRMDAVAAALQVEGLPVPWDRKAAFDHQVEASRRALRELPDDRRRAVEELLPLALAALHRRVPLAFKVRDGLSEAEYETLRSGVSVRLGPDHYLRVLGEERFRRAAAHSLLLAAVTTVITTALALAAAHGVNRRIVPGAGLARFALLVPLVSPPVVVATAAVLLFGRNGLVTYELLDRSLGWIDASTSNLYGLAGVVVAQVLSFLPAAFIVFDNMMSRQDGRLDEAAASLGADPWRAFRHVGLPMAQPGIIRAATLVFILSMTDFGNPMVIGKDLPVLAGVLYDEMIGFQNTPLASAIAVWLIVPALAVYLLLDRIGRRKRFETAGVAAPSAIPAPRAARIGLGVLVWSIVGFSAVIYLTIAAGAFVTVWGRDWSPTILHFTSAEVVPGLVSGYAGIAPVWTSLAVAGIAAPLGGLMAIGVAYLADRFRSAATESIAFLVMLPAILPGAVFGIGYVVAFNAPFGIRELSLNGTHAILVLNILFGNLFVGVLAGRALLRRLDRSVEEAAASLGATQWQRFRLVVLPVMRRAVLLGGLYVFVDGLSTFSAVVFLQGPDIDLAAVAIFDSAESAYYGTACAMSVAVLLVVFAVMAAIRLVERNSGEARRAGA